MNTSRKETLRYALRLVLVAAAVAAIPAWVIWTLYNLGNDAVVLPPNPPTVENFGPPDAGPAEDAGAKPVPRVLVFDRLPLFVLPKVRAVAENTVPVRAAFDNAYNGFGTGFVVKNGWVVTAAHIVSSQGYDRLLKVFVYCGDREVEAQIKAVDRYRDTVVLAADCRGSTLSIDRGRLAEDDKLYVSGFTYSFGERSVVRRFLERSKADTKTKLGPLDPKLYDVKTVEIINGMIERKLPPLQAITGTLVQGNSGSPVFREDGSVVGMIVMVNVAQARSYIVPAATLRHMLKEAGVK